MKKTLDDIRQELEVEIDLAGGLSEIMLMVCTGSKSFDRHDVTFENTSSAFCLITELLENHVQSLNDIANRLIDFENDLKSK